MAKFDIIVIGAGPAGSATAAWAAKQGLNAALVDKAHFPRNKLCGGLFTGRSRRYFREIFEADLDTRQTLTRTQIAFWHAGQELACLSDVPPLHLTMRVDLDTQMLTHACAAGAHDFTGHAIKDIDDTTITLRDGTKLQAAILIGADGVNSVVAKHLFGTAFDTQTIGFALETEAPHAPTPVNEAQLERSVRIDFAAAQWGYGWSFPKAETTTIGVCGLRKHNADMKAHMARYLQTLDNPQSPKLLIKGHHLPFGDFRRVPGRANVLLVGDAAGLVDPITGEGIAFALKSGQLAAQAAYDALANKAPHTALRRYKRSLKEIHRTLRIARTLRLIVFAPQWQKAFLTTFANSGTVRHLYMRMLAGEVEYPEIARRVLARMPRYVMNGFRQNP